MTCCVSDHWPTSLMQTECVDDWPEEASRPQMHGWGASAFQIIMTFDVGSEAWIPSLKGSYPVKQFASKDSILIWNMYYSLIRPTNKDGYVD